MTRTVWMTAMMALVFGAATAGTVRAETACGATAKIMRQVCKDQAKADFGLDLGSCANVTTKETRKVCRTAAKGPFGDGKDECADQFDSRTAFCAVIGGDPYDPPISQASFLSPAATAANPNPFLPLVPGTVRTYQETNGETVVTTVTNGTRVVNGVTTIVVHDVGSMGGKVFEDTEDYLAQHVDGSVWYFGEVSQSFDADGRLEDLHGSFLAGVDGAKPGIAMQAAPTVGLFYRQEFALGIAEDAAEVTSITGTETTPGGSCTANCLVTRDFNILEPGHNEAKYYAPGIGLILEVNLETGKRTELRSVVTPP